MLWRVLCSLPLSTQIILCVVKNLQLPSFLWVCGFCACSNLKHHTYPPDDPIYFCIKCINYKTKWHALLSLSAWSWSYVNWFCLFFLINWRTPEQWSFMFTVQYERWVFWYFLLLIDGLFELSCPPFEILVLYVLNSWLNNILLVFQDHWYSKCFILLFWTYSAFVRWDTRYQRTLLSNPSIGHANKATTMSTGKVSTEWCVVFTYPTN